MEEKKELKTFNVTYKCPKCKIGYLIHSGISFSTNPPQNPHLCNNYDCNYTKTFDGVIYPYIVHE